MSDQPVVTQPEATTPTPAPKTYTPKPCATCGEMFTPTTSGREKWCPAHRPDQKSQKREQKQKERKRDKAKAEKAASQWNSDTEIKKAEAIEILQTDRLIRNPRVAAVCWELATVAARNLKLPVNAHLFTHGVAKTLEARTKKKAVDPPEINDVWVSGRIREHEIAALYDYGMSWREVGGKKYTLDEYKELRQICVTDLFRFGKDVLGLDLHDQPHGRWSREMFVVKRDLLPEKYTWEDVKVALAQLSEIHQRMLISSRSSYKSSVNLVDLLQWVLAFGGDIRIFIISSTAPLSAGFLRKFRSYWTVKNPNEPTLFNLLLPEFMIHPGDDPGLQKNFISPMRQLDLIQPTLTSTSLDSEGLAGERMDIFVAEDVAEISNSSNPEQRAKTLEKFDLLRELLEPFGYLQVVCTPISAGSGTEDDPGDIYSTLLRREEAHRKNGGDPRLLHMICPAWTVKEGVNKKAWDTALVEEEVDLLFPPRLGFKYLMAKLRESEKTFRQQSLCSWVPDVDESLKIQFTEADLHRATKASGFFQGSPVLQIGLSIDRATSTSRYADLSALVLGKLMQVNGKLTLVVADVKMDRWKESELIRHVADLVQQHGPSFITLERDRGVENFVSSLRQEILRRGLPVPFVRVNPVSIKPGAKFVRIKRLELPLAEGKLMFILGPWVDAFFAQMARFDGGPVRKSTALQKDDGPDALGSLLENFPQLRLPDEVPEDDEERKRLEEQEAAEIRRRAQYDRMFGPYGGTRLHLGPPTTQAPTVRQWLRAGQPEPEPEPKPVKPVDPRDRVFSYNRVVQPSADRNTPFGIKGRWRHRG